MKHQCAEDVADLLASSCWGVFVAEWKYILDSENGISIRCSKTFQLLNVISIRSVNLINYILTATNTCLESLRIKFGPRDFLKEILFSSM